MNGRAALDEQPDRLAEEQDVLDPVEPPDRDHDVPVGGHPERRLEPAAIAPAGIEQAVVEAPPQKPHPFGAEQRGEAEPVVRARREHESATTEVVVEATLHARLGAPGDVQAAEQQAGQPPGPTARSTVAAVKTRV